MPRYAEYEGKTTAKCILCGVRFPPRDRSWSVQVCEGCRQQYKDQNTMEQAVTRQEYEKTRLKDKYYG